MIRRFGDVRTEDLFHGRKSARVRRLAPEFKRAALRKLDMISAAVVLDDLRVPPGNRLEALSGDRAGQHSIRVNDQWRIVFRWVDGAAEDVALVDYH
jgi:proteic killer suppression protein